MSHGQTTMLKAMQSALTSTHNSKQGGGGGGSSNSNISGSNTNNGNSNTTSPSATTAAAATATASSAVPMTMTATTRSGVSSHSVASTDEYAHPYWHVCSSMPSSYWDYEHAQIDYNHDVEAYALLQKIGRGKYSEVFCGVHRRNGSLCVLKLLKPVRLRKIKREISLLRNLCGGPNIVRLLDVLSDPRSGTPVLVTEYVPNAVTLRGLMVEQRLTNFDMRFYLYEVLRALDFAHRRGIFHRDIKPHNIMIHHERRLVRVIDWGLGEYYIHGEPLNCAVATRHYKAPELLLGYRHYDYSLDIWCVGCILAGMLFLRDPFFAGASNEDQLVKVVSVFGSGAVYSYMAKYNLPMSRKLHALLSPLRSNKVSWSKFIPASKSSSTAATPPPRPPSSGSATTTTAAAALSSSSSFISAPLMTTAAAAAAVGASVAQWCDETALDLLDRMLRFDHAERIRADEAMQHPFFAPVRAALAADAQEQYPTLMASSYSHTGGGGGRSSLHASTSAPL